MTNQRKNPTKSFKNRNVQSDSKESDDSEYERQVKKRRKRQVKKNTDMKKKVKVALVILTVKAAPIVKKSR